MASQEPSQSGSRGRGSQGRGRGNWSRGRSWRGGRGRWNGGGGGGGSSWRSSSGGGSYPASSQSQRSVPATLLEQSTPYPGWSLYFPTQVYSDHSVVVQRAHTFEKYFLSWKALHKSMDLGTKGYFTVDFKELLSDQVIIEGAPDLEREIRESPETIIAALGLAMHQMLSADERSGMRAEPLPGMQSSSSTASLPKIQARIINFEPITPLKSLKANYYGKFVCVTGTVVRVSNVKPFCTQMAFECAQCNHVQALQLPDGKFVTPVKCPAANCRSRTFLPKRKHTLTETIDWQNIRVQEMMTEDHRESGRIPRTIDCELTNDLVDSCVPGDTVTVSGVVKVLSSDEGRGRQKDKCMFLLYLQANSVTTAKGRSSGGEGETKSSLAIEFTMKELYAIEEIQSEPNLFRLLVGSVCPTIYGHEMVKAGLVLGLFGGSQKYSSDKNRVPVRGDPHILVVGDPGLGKSQMLQAMANVAPRSVYVCGNTTTSSGLTVTLTKDAGSGGDYALEAGALVLADQGCCCIDEFDKMGNQHQALLEAMEQQSISIAKAGIVCSLPARASILAAANPIGGHYNKSKTVAENLRMGSALLSRFDLVFILLDKPDEELDARLSEHVMALHAGGNRARGSVSGSQMTVEERGSVLDDEGAPLSERLKVQRHEAFDALPPVLLRKYVGYARKYVHPKITPEAAQVIQKFYLDLRRQHQTKDSTPITTRQLESLIRLTEARARLELREEATEGDAKDVIEIMKHSMQDTYMDEFGFLDYQRSQHGSGMSGRSKGKKLIAALQRISEQTYNNLFTVQEIREIAKSSGIQVGNMEEFVLSLNQQGYLLKKGPRVYQLQSAEY